MSAEQFEISIPKAPKVPSDLVFLLTYCAGPEKTRGEFFAEETGFDTTCPTLADELS